MNPDDHKFSAPIDSEILTSTELFDITGRARKDQQIAWLRSSGWKFVTNALGAPIVGRWYARMKLAGVDFTEPQLKVPAGMPDFSKAR
ncbi:MAG: DUF4224 domain-containing protein [Janthinobacterium lividum]